MVVRKQDARIWSVGVTLLAVAVAVTWWLLREADDPAPEPATTTEAAPARSEESPALEQLAPAGSLVRATDPVPGAVLRLWMSTPGSGARLCTVRATADGGPTLEAASCVASSLDATDTKLAMAPAGADVAVARGAQLVALDGSTLFEAAGGEVRAAFVTEDGAAAVLLGRPEGTFELVRTRRGAEEERVAPLPAVGPGSPMMVWDQLLWLERREGAGDVLRARGVFGGEPVEVGEVPPRSERIRGCRSSEALAVVVDGELVHGVKQLAVTFRDDRGWSTPVTAEAGVYDDQLSCRGREATLTWLEAMPAGGDTRRVVQARCTPSGCERSEAHVTFSGSDPVVADLAGRVLLLYADGSETTARLAPLVELDDAPAMEGLPQAEGAVLARRLFVRGGAAVLVYRTAAGLFAARIDAGGRASPLPVR